jgi:hypothetical protein
MFSTAPHLPGGVFLFRLIVIGMICVMMTYLLRLIVFDYWEARRQNGIDDPKIQSSEGGYLPSLNKFWKKCPKPVRCLAPAESCKCYGNDETIQEEGKITMETSFGKALHSLAQQDDVKSVLEVGTGFGGGSTKSIALGLKDKQAILYTLEVR